MSRRIHLITLGVGDMARSRAFYEAAFGLVPSSASADSTVFYQLDGGVVLTLYDMKMLRADLRLGAEAPSRPDFGGITLAQNQPTRAKVDAVLARALDGGARLIAPAAETFWGGYVGYFADPDGHVWEIAHNPHFELGPDGSLRLPA